MLQFGIVTVADADSWGGNDLPLPRVAVTVLDEIGAVPNPLEERLIAEIVNQFPGGDHNMLNTFAGRYAGVDPDVAEEIRSRFPVGSEIRIHDMAASNSITSLEFFQHLQDFPNLTFVASDLYNEAYVVSALNGAWRVVFDSRQLPVQFIGRNMVISAFQLERKRFPVNRILQSLLKAFVLPRAARTLSQSSKADGADVRRIRLVHPLCAAKLHADRRFTLGRHDILETDFHQSDVVRLMGVVQSVPQEMLRPMFRAIGRSVKDGGLLVLGVRDRAHPTNVPTTIFSRAGRRLIPVRDIMGDYRCKEIVMGVDLGDASDSGTGQENRF